MIVVERESTEFPGLTLKIERKIATKVKKGTKDTYTVTYYEMIFRYKDNPSHYATYHAVMATWAKKYAIQIDYEIPSGIWNPGFPVGMDEYINKVANAYYYKLEKEFWGGKKGA